MDSENESNNPAHRIEALKPVELAQAQFQGYLLLSQLFLSGVTDQNRATLEQVPALSELVPPEAHLDELATAYYRLFGFNVFPFESIFLDSRGLLGGPVTDRVIRRYQALAFPFETMEGNADHVGHELATMAQLCLAEWEARKREQTQTAVVLQQAQCAFLEDHLLRWLSPLIIAIQAQKNDLFTAVSNVTLSLVSHHYQTLLDVTDGPAVNWALPPVKEPLADPNTGLREIAKHLSTPLFSGLFLGRDDIAQLARQLSLPRGFGDREQLLLNLMRSAVQYDQFPALIMQLKELVAAWEAAYQSQTAVCPQLHPFIQPWLERCQQTSQLLIAMKLISESAWDED